MKKVGTPSFLQELPQTFYLPDVADLIVVEINFKDYGEFSESSFGQFGDFVAL